MTRQGLLYDLPETSYLADGHSLSASGAKQLLKSPAHFKMPQWFSDAADIGSAFHTETLGVGQEVVVVDAASWRGKEAGAAQAEARADGKAPILAKDLATVRAMREAVLAHPKAAELLALDGQPEVSAFWHDETWNVTRRCRVDYLTDHLNIDLKSTNSVDAKDIARTVVNYGYDLSAAWYEDVLTGLGVDLLATALIFCEKTPPYRVRVVELSADFLARGRALATRALQIYADCVEADHWPHYDDPDFTTIYPPAWAREIAS